jgi:hypothetical protein
MFIGVMDESSMHNDEAAGGSISGIRCVNGQPSGIEYKRISLSNITSPIHVKANSPSTV